MLNVITLTISIIAQLAASFMALKLIAKDRRNAGWIAIAGAIFIMCIRRVIAGYYVVSGMYIFKQSGQV
jgi:hypothetical protein